MFIAIRLDSFCADGNLAIPMTHRFWPSVLLTGAVLTTGAMSALPSAAAIFLVNKNFWGNHTTQGTFSWAINQSNINPGKDTIVVTTDVGIDDYLGGANGPTQYAAHITDPSGLDIIGNGHKLTGEPSFINLSGVLHTKTDPAAIMPGDVLVDQAVSFATVSDNVSSLFIDGLVVDGLNEFLSIGKGSSVVVRNSVFRNMGAFGKPALPLFSVFDDSTLTLTGVSIKHVNRYKDITQGFEYGWVPVIEGLNANLNIDRSLLNFYISATQGAVAWAGGTVNVVSSQLFGRGLSISDYLKEGVLKEGVLNVVNSVFRPDGHSATSRIQAYNGGEANVIASTIQYDAQDTTDVPMPGDPFFSCPENYKCNGAPLQAFNGGTINLRSSSVSVLGTEVALIRNPYSDTYDDRPGTLTADSSTFVKPVAAMSPAALKALFNQVNLLTSGVPYTLAPGYLPEFPSIYIELPEGASPRTPGPLLNAVADADGVNKLINPIDGSVITHDVYGHARTRNGMRDAGAVQATLVPGPLPLLGCGSALAWSRRFRRRLRQADQNCSTLVGRRIQLASPWRSL